jgi:hypothetical protein
MPNKKSGKLKASGKLDAAGKAKAAAVGGKKKKSAKRGEHDTDHEFR